MVQDGGVEGGQGERRTQAPFGILPDPEDLELAGEVGEGLSRHHHVPVDLGGEELPWHGDVLHQELQGPLPAPAEGVDAGVHHQPGAPHQRRADRAEQAAIVGIQPGFLGELLGVQAPSLGEHGKAALALKGGEAGEQLKAGELQMMPGHRFVEGHHFDVPAGAGGGSLGVEPERPGPPAVQTGRGVVGRCAAHGDDLRHGRHVARRRKGFREELARPCLGPLHGGRRLADGLLRGNPAGRVPQRGEYLIQPGKPQAGAQLHGPGLQRGDLIQAGLVQFFRRQRQGRIDPDRPGVVLLAAGQVDQSGPFGRPGPRQQLPDGGDPPRQRRPHHLLGDRPAFGLPRRRCVPPLRRPRGQHRADARSGQDLLSPDDGLLDQRSDRQPPLRGSGPQPLADLVEPGAAAPQAGQVGLGRRRVDQDRPRGHRQEGRRSRVLHGGDRMIRPRQIDDLPLLGGHLHHAVERDGIRRRELVTRDRVGLPQELPDLGAPGLLALLALVRDQIVVPGKAVHGGSERILLQPTPMEPVGQVTW